MLALLDIPDLARPAHALPSLPAIADALVDFGNWEPDLAYAEALRIIEEGDVAAFKAAINSTDD